MKTLTFYYNDEPLLDDIDLRDGKANPFGWSQYKIYHQEKFIGWLESGGPEDLEPGYTYKISET